MQLGRSAIAAVTVAAMTVAAVVAVAGGTAGSAERTSGRFRQREAVGDRAGNTPPAQFVAESGGRIAVVSADTGRVVRYLTAAKPGGGAMDPVVSHDGRTVWFSRGDGSCAAYLASVPVTGGDEHIVPGSGEAGPESAPLPRPGRPQLAYARGDCHHDTDQALIVSDLGGDEGHGQLGLRPLDWSRDGDHLLATTADGSEVRLLQMSKSGAILAGQALKPADPTPDCRLAVVGFSPDDNHGYVAVRRCGQSDSQARRSLVLLDKDLAQRQTVVRLPRGQDFVDRLAFDTTGHSLLYSTSTPDDGVTLWLWRDGDVRRLGRPSRYRHPSWLP